MFASFCILVFSIVIFLNVGFCCLDSSSSPVRAEFSKDSPRMPVMAQLARANIPRDAMDCPAHAFCLQGEEKFGVSYGAVSVSASQEEP